MSRFKNQKLFDNSDSEEDCTLGTNKSYAKHYDEFRKKEILSHLKNISDEDDSSDDASTDEELVNPEFDKEFLKSLAFLKSKDPKKYEKIPKFFENVPTVEETIKEKQLKKSKKPVTVADYQLQRLIETEGRMSEEENDDAEAPDTSMSYVKEQEKIKNDLKKALEDSSEDEESKLFKVREKPREEVQKEDEDYLKWLAGQKKVTSIGEDAKVLQPLKEFWTSRSLPKADKFLRDYIVNKRYVDDGHIATYEDIVGLSDDEEEVEQQNEYEQKYNFRFEEPDNEFIKRFPRKIEDTVRAEDNKRKEKRKERDERKAQEKEIKMKDLRELQNIRKREIEEKLLLLKEVTGNEEFALKEDDLNSDFDPAAHDRRMAEMFDNEYYGIDEGDQKPEFPDIDEELNIENWDNFDKSKVPYAPVEDEGHCEDGDFVMDCDYDPEEEKKKKNQNELIEMSKGRKRRKKISKLAEIIKREKPAYDPATEKTYEEYLDEYYKLDYEDIIGDQPCRFRYTETVPNDFGLTVEEILMASNKELNQWASLKKTMQNRPKNVEMNDVDKYNRRRNNVDLKKKIFQSIYGEPDDDSEGEGEQNIQATTSGDPKPGSSNGESSKTTPSTNGKNTNKKQKQATQNRAKAPVSVVKREIPATQIKPSPVKQNGKKGAPAKASVSVVESKEIPATEVKPSPAKQNGKGKQQNQVQNDKNEKSQKRKLDNSAEGEAQPAQPQQKKKKFNKNKNQKQNNKQTPATDLTENRLKAFGINPKKFKNKLKYGGQQNQAGKHHSKQKS